MIKFLDLQKINNQNINELKKAKILLSISSGVVLDELKNMDRKVSQ